MGAIGLSTAVALGSVSAAVSSYGYRHAPITLKD
jgi:hypothetical protein